MDEPLLDSSYLLPIFGAELEYRNFDSVFPKLPEKYAVKYNPASLIETKWFVLRNSRRQGTSHKEPLLISYRRGLLSLQRDTKIESTTLTNEEIEELSDSILSRFEIRDYFDRLIYSTATYLDCILLTEDAALHELYNKSGNDLRKPKGIMKWKDLLRSVQD